MRESTISTLVPASGKSCIVDASLGAVWPMRMAALALVAIFWPSSSKGKSLSYPPAMIIFGWSNASNAAIALCGVVAIESLYQETPFICYTSSSR